MATYAAIESMSHPTLDIDNFNQRWHVGYNHAEGGGDPQQHLEVFLAKNGNS